MLIMIFDTETTGLPKSKYLLYNNLHEWPHIVQFSYVIYNTVKNSIVKVVDNIIKIPDNVTISDESIAIHKINNEMCRTNGKDIKEVLKIFEEDLQKVYVLVGHNLSFDIDMVKAECMRQIELEKINNSNSEFYHLLIKLFSKKLKYCTMQESIELCQIKINRKDGSTYNKFPKLAELHNFLFGFVPNNLHNSLLDVYVCLRCFCKLSQNVDIYEKSDEIKKIYNEKLL